MVTVREMIEDYDWQQVFAYAGKGTVPDASGFEPTNYATEHTRVPIGRCEGASADIGTDPFDLNDVDEVLAADAGENDERDWITVARLKDGRIAFVFAGCDYTGWDCQAGGQVVVSNDLGNLVRFGLTTEARERFTASEHTSNEMREALITEKVSAR